MSHSARRSLRRRTRAARAVASLAAASLALARAAAAQETRGVPLGAVRDGEPVRLRAAPLGDDARRPWCRGTVVGRTRDTLHVRPAPATRREPACATATWSMAEAELRVARGMRRSRLAHTLTGFGVGALAGGALGLGFVAVTCALHPPCEEAAFAYAILGTLGTAAGAGVGTVVGLAWPTGPRWVPARGFGAVEVGSVVTRRGPGLAFRLR